MGLLQKRKGDRYPQLASRGPWRAVLTSQQRRGKLLLTLECGHQVTRPARKARRIPPHAARCRKCPVPAGPGI